MKFILLLILLTSTALAQTGGTRAVEFDSVQGIDYNTNIIINPSGKKNAANVTTSSAAVARVTTAGYQINGVASLSCDASALNGYCEWTINNITSANSEGNCEFKGLVKGDGSLYQAQILNGSSVVLAQTQVLGNQTTWTPFSVNYVCGSSRKVRITQTVAGTAPAINLGKLYYGQATNIGSGIAPNTFTAAISSAGVVSAETGGDWINGNCAVIATSTYTCTFNSGFFTAQPNCGAFPGTLANSAKMTAYSSTAAAYQTQNAAGTNTATDAFFTCTKTGSDYSQNTITANNYDFDWTTCPSISGSWVTNTTYTCLYKRQGGDALFQIKAATSGAPTSASLSFNLPITIDTARLTNSAAASILGDAIASDNAGINSPGIVRYNSTTSVTVSIVNTAGTYGDAATITQIVPFTFGASDYVAINFRVPVVGWSNTQNAPQLLGSVTSNASNALRIESAKLACNGSSAITSQSSSWISSIGNISSGACAVTIASGVFSSTPNCVISLNQTIGAFTVGPQVTVTSATAASVGCTYLNSGSSTVVNCTSSNFELMCMGAR